MNYKYKLYYWQAPFRGNFIQLLLEELNIKYQRLNAEKLYPVRSKRLTYPGMAPPYLYIVSSKKYFSQMPAILVYLSKKHKFLPKNLEKEALIVKIIADCHDILLEFTNSYGKQMWTQKEWDKFQEERWIQWLNIFSKTGKLHGLKQNKGFLLGSSITTADIATTALFGSILHSFPPLEEDFKTHAPSILNLCKRIEQRPRIKECLEEQRDWWGDIYCGGEIEKSLRKVILKKEVNFYTEKTQSLMI